MWWAIVQCLPELKIRAFKVINDHKSIRWAWTSIDCSLVLCQFNSFVCTFTTQWTEKLELARHISELGLYFLHISAINPSCSISTFWSVPTQLYWSTCSVPQLRYSSLFLRVLRALIWKNYAFAIISSVTNCILSVIFNYGLSPFSLANITWYI